VTRIILPALIQGSRRAVFSDEAGVGAVAIAHSAVRADAATLQGFSALSM
jgi:Na+/alanine symporter